MINGVLEAEDDRYRTCDYIFLCAPVEHNIEYLKYLKDVISDQCIITDAGSVKGPIHEAVEELGLDHCFIGGHPMAGSREIRLRQFPPTTCWRTPIISLHPADRFPLKS